jgi:hypothetical protein
MNRRLHQTIRPLLIFFVIVTTFCITGKGWLQKNGVDRDVLIIGNMVLFLVSLSGFLITNKSLRSSNTHTFLRALYGSFILKFFVVAAAAFIYFMMAGKNLNKPALFICGGLYIIYSAIEVSSLMKILKKKKNA